MSPDGKHLYATGAGVVEHRVLAGGGIAQRPGARGCITRDWDAPRPVVGCARAVGMAAPAAVAVAPDGRFVYTSDDYLPDVFDLRPPPGYFQVFRRYTSNVACGRSTATIVRGTSRALPLPCSDADRNPFTTEILTRPNLGSLGAIDQSAHTVRYTAPKRRTGRTAFTFRSAYGSQRSAVGTLTVVVTRKPRHMRGLKLSLRYRTVRGRTVLTRLRLRGVPRGAKVAARCRYRGHRCAGKARKAFAKRHAPRSVGLGQRFGGVRLKAGSRIKIRVSKPGFVSAVRVVAIRSGKRPKVSSR
jgi:hypothetical protein